MTWEPKHPPAERQSNPDEAVSVLDCFAFRARNYDSPDDSPPSSLIPHPCYLLSILQKPVNSAQFTGDMQYAFPPIINRTMDFRMRVYKAMTVGKDEGPCGLRRIERGGTSLQARPAFLFAPEPRAATAMCRTARCNYFFFEHFS
jgi:hypothetical protein